MAIYNTDNSRTPEIECQRYKTTVNQNYFFDNQDLNIIWSTIITLSIRRDRHKQQEIKQKAEFDQDLH